MIIIGDIDGGSFSESFASLSIFLSLEYCFSVRDGGQEQLP
jgi:hypothetical protein